MATITFGRVSEVNQCYTRPVYADGQHVGEVQRQRRSRHGAKNVDYRFVPFDRAIEPCRAAMFADLSSRIAKRLGA